MSSLSPDKIIPNSNSSDEAWKQYHMALKSDGGRLWANQLFTQTWDARGGVNVKGNTTMLRDYLKGQGLTVGTNGLQNLEDFGLDVADSIGNFLSVGKWVGIGLAVVFVGGLGLLIYGIAKKPGTIMLATPQGRAASMLKA